MAGVVVSSRLCNYILSNQQDDLLVIFETFSKSVTVPEYNTFFQQNEILDKMLTNLENNKRSTISLNSLYKGIDEEEKEIIASLDINKKIIHNHTGSKILEIEYFDDDKFMSVLDVELNNIQKKYNLHAADDYNKLYNFLYSLKLTLQASDDLLGTLTNQYSFFKEHSSYAGKRNGNEFITIYGNKIFKFDILKEIINKYSDLIIDKKQKQIKNKNISKH